MKEFNFNAKKPITSLIRDLEAEKKERLARTQHKQLKIGEDELRVSFAPESKFGFKVYWRPAEDKFADWKECRIYDTGRSEGYARIYKKSYGAKKPEESLFSGKQIYLHQVIFAWYCNWNRLVKLVDEFGRPFEIHHIEKRSEKGSIGYWTSPMNLVCLSKQDHAKLHSLTKFIEESDPKENRDGLIAAQEEYSKILSKAVLLRDKSIKKWAGDEGLERLEGYCSDLLFRHKAKSFENIMENCAETVDKADQE